MKSLEEIREDLKDIRYYYSKQKMFDHGVVQNDVVEKATKYNEAMKKAPVRLYDLYVSLYINNNTQAALAFDWDVSCEYIKMQNKSSCEFLQKQIS